MVDHQFAVSVRQWLLMVRTVGDDHLIQDFTAHEAVPGMEIDLSCVILDILKPFEDH